MKSNNSKKLRIHSLLSVLTIVLGGALLVYMVVAEGELGAIPLLLIITGAIWYFITRARNWSQHESG